MCRAAATLSCLLPALSCRVRLGCLVALGSTALLLLSACANRAPAPIEDHSERSARPAARVYTVLRGDTLFAIAFRYGLDYRRFAAANRIPLPYTIYPGQRLKLQESALLPARPSIAQAPVASAPTTSPRPVPRVTVTSGSAEALPPGAAKPNSRPQVNPKVAQTPVPRPPTVTVPSVAQQRADNAPVERWLWPAQGNLSRRFESSLHKGIDISGKRGDSVIASASGVVVYAGSGIAGYGLMLIVKHNDTYLSAYGHNDSLEVGEGDSVRSGQTIARRGSSGTDSVKLHFEIRRGGRPIDPLKLLPRR